MTSRRRPPRTAPCTSNGGNNQKWRVVDLGGGAVRLLNKNSGKVAEVFQASSADAAVIDQWAINGGTHPIWQMATPWHRGREPRRTSRRSTARVL